MPSWKKVITSGSNASLNSLYALSITGSLLGTASFATQALSSSFASTASYVLQAVSASYALSSSHSQTSTIASLASLAVLATTAQTASYVENAQTASYFDGVTKLIAGAGVSVFPVSGKGDVTVSAAASTTFPYTGSAIISGSLTVTGSVLFQGAGTGMAGPYDAIKIDDANFTRQLYDFTAGSASIDFGNRSLIASTGIPAASWDGTTGVINMNLYASQRINPSVKSTLYTFNTQAGQILDDSYLDAAVVDYDLVYLGNDGQWYQVDQTTDSSTKMLGIVRNVFSQTGSVQIEGDVVVSTTAGSYPVVNGAGYGAPIYIREGAGTLMSTTTPTSGYVRLLGYCYYNQGGTEWIMKFRPSNEWIQL